MVLEAGLLDDVYAGECLFGYVQEEKHDRHRELMHPPFD